MTGHKIFTAVPTTVVMFPPTTMVTSSSPLTDKMFCFWLEILGTVPSKQKGNRSLNGYLRWPFLAIKNVFSL